MAITILPPPPPPQDYDDSDNSEEESDDGGVALDNDGDLDMRLKKRARHGDSRSVVTPGEVVTDDPQWMRFVPPSHTSAILRLCAINVDRSRRKTES